MGRPAERAFDEFLSAVVGLKAPDVPKAMALIQAELVEHPDEMLELARAGWAPREAEGFTALSFMGRGRLAAWVESARAGVAEGGGGGRSPGRQAAARAAGPPPAAPRFSPPRSPLIAPRPRLPAPAPPAALAVADHDEARVPLT